MDIGVIHNVVRIYSRLFRLSAGAPGAGAARAEDQVTISAAARTRAAAAGDDKAPGQGPVAASPTVPGTPDQGPTRLTP